MKVDKYGQENEYVSENGGQSEKDEKRGQKHIVQGQTCRVKDTLRVVIHSEHERIVRGAVQRAIAEVRAASIVEQQEAHNRRNRSSQVYFTQRRHAATAAAGFYARLSWLI